MTAARGVDELLRRLAPQVLGALLLRHRHQFDLCEDAVQDALVDAARQWSVDGLPAEPAAWLTTVASRRYVDRVRQEEARRRREMAAHAASVSTGSPGGTGSDGVDVDRDDTVALLVLCCHPSLTPVSQLALTLRAVGGLTTAEIARAFFVPEATIAQRISRAKQRIREADGRFEAPEPAELDGRVAVVLHVLYLIFNEGYAAAGDSVTRVDLSDEAIRITRMLHAARPEDTEVAGLLALMLLTDARRAARSPQPGKLVTLADQDRSLWDTARIAEGVDLITRTLAEARLGPYQVQAAIAAVHDEAADDAGTDWPQILGLYQVLDRIGPNPMATLSRAVAVAKVRGPDAALALLAELAGDERIAEHYRFHAVRGHILEMAGDTAAARSEFLDAARHTTSGPERRQLLERAARSATQGRGPSSVGAERACRVDVGQELG